MSLCSRRQILRAGAVVFTLPWLEQVAWAEKPLGGAQPPRRLVHICTNFGLYGPSFFPEEAGPNYKASEYIEVLGDLRDRFTVFSGISHPQIGGDHASEACFLTSAKHPNSPTFRNSMSVDVLASRHVGAATRFPLLTMTTGDGPGLSYTASGAGIPAHQHPSRVFKELFLAGNPNQIKAEVERLKRGQSILDRMGDRFSALQKELGANDKRQLDDYNEAVRDMEKQLQANEAWVHKPKPTVEEKAPTDISDKSDFIGRADLLCDLAQLALRTDSTRVVTIAIKGIDARPPIEGVTEAHHALTHHGRDPNKIEQLRLVEKAKMGLFRKFISALRDTSDGAGSLLDNTQVLIGSNLGDASWHGTQNLPILLAGGSWKHGQHVAGDKKDNTPLGKLFVSMLQQFGIETDTFGSGKGTITGLV